MMEKKKQSCVLRGGAVVVVVDIGVGVVFDFSSPNKIPNVMEEIRRTRIKRSNHRL